MTPHIEISRDIAASPDAVYAAISDVTRMGEWSEECHACEWHDGFDGPVVGATFDGHNRHGEHEWTTQGKVIEAESGRAFAFECSMFDFHFSTWGYNIEPTEAGCTVTETWTDTRGRLITTLGGMVSGVTDRATFNRAGMETTLANLAGAVETAG